MARDLDRVIVLDLEATCWEGSPPAGEQSEIIEIGVCLLDPKTGVIEGSAGHFVWPTHSTISPFCTELTTITQADVDGAKPLSVVLPQLGKSLQTKRRCFASWGDYDRRQLMRECEDKHIKYPFGPTHLNVKTLFALKHGLRRELGLGAALQHIGETFEGTAHRGVDDAKNIAKVLASLLA